MAKYRLEKLKLLVSLLLFFSGCGYKFISGGDRNIFLGPVINSTLQPGIDLRMNGELKKTFIEYPGFSVVSRENEASFIMRVNIKKWERLPLFFSENGDDEIIIAKFKIETEIVLTGPGRDTLTETIDDTFSVSLATEYREDEVLQKISRKLAEGIYFRLMDRI